MPTRRTFLLTTALAAPWTAIFAYAGEAPDAEARLPAGALDSYDWGTGTIPSSGGDFPGKEMIDAAVTDAMREHGVVGCGVSVIRDDQVIYAKGFGYGEIGKSPFLKTTASRCGSLAKPVTALCALVLADQKKLDLDAKILPLLKDAGIVPKPLDNFEVDERLSQIAVRDLMDHTSGLPGWATYTAWRVNRNVAALHGLRHVATAADVVSDALGNCRLESEPGTKFEYANANFVILARIVEAASKMRFNEFLTRVAMPKFGLRADEIYVSRNQTDPHCAARGKNEAAYYQTSPERFVSFIPSEQAKGRIYAEAYRGYTTEASDGAGGIACSAVGLGKIIANLHSVAPALSAASMAEILTPPHHYKTEAGFDPSKSNYYSKGFNVRYSGGRPWLSHTGMTQHCGGCIGHNAGYQFVMVSNWNTPDRPYVDAILDHALAEAMRRLQT